MVLAAPLFAALAVVASAQLAAPGLKPIGAAAAVHGTVQATAPGQQVGRVLNSGKPLFLNDHVTSDAQGKLQVLLVDETVFTLGPNADMVLDEFVYDPKTSAGKVAAHITKGAFRFVTGKVARARPEDMKVKLNVGTIGIRGTVVVGETGPEGSTIINAGAGANNNADERPSAITVENAGRTVDVVDSGEGVTVRPNQPPSSPGEMGEELDRLSGALADRPTGKPSSQAALDAPATQASGQSTAQGSLLAVLGNDQAAEGRSSDQTMTEAQQQGLSIADGVSQWSDLASLQGQWMYQGSGTYSGGSGAGTFSFQMNVNFDARTLGGTSTGGPSQITMSGALADQTQVNAMAFGTSGPATIVLDPALTNAVFNGTRASFLNAGGQAGASMRIDLKDSAGATSGSGSGNKQHLPGG